MPICSFIGSVTLSLRLVLEICWSHSCSPGDAYDYRPKGKEWSQFKGLLIYLSKQRVHDMPESIRGRGTWVDLGWNISSTSSWRVSLTRYVPLSFFIYYKAQIIEQHRSAERSIRDDTCMTMWNQWQLLLFGVAGSLPILTEVHVQQLPSRSRSSSGQSELDRSRILAVPEPFSYTVSLQTDAWISHWATTFIYLLLLRMLSTQLDGDSLCSSRRFKDTAPHFPQPHTLPWGVIIR